MRCRCGPPCPQQGSWFKNRERDGGRNDRVKKRNTAILPGTEGYRLEQEEKQERSDPLVPLPFLILNASTAQFALQPTDLVVFKKFC